MLFIVVLTIGSSCQSTPVLTEETGYMILTLPKPKRPSLDLISPTATDSEAFSVSNKNAVKLITYIDNLDVYIENQKDYYESIIQTILK